MNWGVVVFPGSNCDEDIYYFIKKIIGDSCKYLWHKEQNINDFDVIILPGGFSYGDYLRPGAIASCSSIMRSIIEFANKGGFVIGICNGFQILIESNLLEGSLLKNNPMRFICKHIFIKSINFTTPFTCSLNKRNVLNIPIAHLEGRFFCTSDQLKKFEDNNQIIFKYCDKNGEITEKINPNGSIKNIAGICNEKKNVLGIMPHPERSSENILGSKDGILLFQSIQKWFYKVA